MFGQILAKVAVADLIRDSLVHSHTRTCSSPSLINLACLDQPGPSLINLAGLESSNMLVRLLDLDPSLINLACLTCLLDQLDQLP